MDNKIKQLTQLMETELYMNRYKGNWEDVKDTDYIFKEFQHHFNKLQTAIKENDKVKQKEYLADCSNFLLMLGNALDLFKEK